QALAAVLGGTQSLHTNSLDETYALPTEGAVRLALRTQQIIAHETGVADTADPLGGAYFVESLTNTMEAAAANYIRRIDELGGMVRAVELGYPQREIAEASYAYQQQLERKEKIVVGVNEFVQPAEEPIPILRIDPQVERRQIQRLREVRANRDARRVEQTLAALRSATEQGDNTMERILDCVAAYATLGEICDVFRAVYGEYREPAII
ncbi:MAG TPA: methylmalonyl-CoA mutase family protein, partial [bacterium]|nr:methylmalonyl-CoA mutase family protein [bacterium]